MNRRMTAARKRLMLEGLALRTWQVDKGLDTLEQRARL